jgi:CheY-like chemotaxis protein
MNCPRCKTPIGPLSDPDSIVTCPGCGSRLMTRSAAIRSQGGPKPAGAAPAVARPAELPPSATLPSTPAMLLGTKPAATSSAAPTGSDTARRRKGEGKASRAETEAALDQLLREVRGLRETQDLILAAIEGLQQAVRSQAASAGALPPRLASGDGLGLSPIRVRPRKTVVLVDDDPQTRAAAVAELLHADVPVRAFDDGNAALSAIAEEKPDVIVLELGLGGDMGGKDLVNMIKATMEWVDIPIVLWTREAVSNPKEARQIHGADEVVPKSGGAAGLVARIITLFRR